MNNEEKRPNSNSNMNRGPRGAGRVAEKPKNFRTAISKLFKNLGNFKIFILVALILAMGGSILSLVAPNRLSDLTDEISTGLVVNQDNLEELSTKVVENVTNTMGEVLTINMSEENILNIMSSSEIKDEDKVKFQEELEELSDLNTDEYLSYINVINNMPDSILQELFIDSIYNDVEISSEEKVSILHGLANLLENNTSDTYTSDLLTKKEIDKLFSKVEIDGKEISSYEQYQFLTIMSNISDDITASELYSKIDEMPESIQEVVKPSMDMDKIKKISLLLVIIYVASALFSYSESIIMAIVANKYAKKLRSDISVKINKLPLKYFDRNLSGDILSRVTNDVDTIAQSMNQSLSSLVSAITLFIGSIIMMFYTNWIMAITAILASLIGFVFMSKILSRSQKYFKARQVELGKLNGHIEEIYSGLNVVKVYNGKKDSDEKFDKLNKSVYECNRKSQFLSGLMQPIMGFIGNFGYVAVCIVGALLVSNDAITFGVIVAFIVYVRLFTNPLSQIAQGLTSLQSTAAASERVFEFLEEDEMVKENVTKVLKPEDVKGTIEFKNVKFGYNDGETIIKNFSASIKPGQKVAIVGPTGAGKTTMVNLLMKFYDIDDGDITIDGISIKDLSRENVHSLFTMVLQDTWLFNGTVKENIVYNKKDVSDQQVIDACKNVGVHHFIKTLSKGYDSKLSDNDSVSSGQRQLLTIARGMIDNAPLLILDEATSNVDTRTEELVQKAMDKLTEGKTSFIIAHRLSTIKNADLILVMKDGNIIEQGNHEELMNQKGFYADLYNSQFEL